MEASDSQMIDELDAAVRRHQRERIEGASTMYASQKMTSDDVRKKTKSAYRRLLDAHLLIAGVLADGMLRVNGKIVPATDETLERGALFASFVIGMDLCERAIEEGRYLQAHALLRQEMETLAQLKAVTKGNRSAHRAPNIAVLEESLRRQYNELSSAAHLSKHHIVQQATEYVHPIEDAPESTSGSRYFPAFDEDLARKSFTLHLLLTVGVLEEYANDVNSRHKDEDCFNGRDVETITLAMRLMKAEGVIEMDETC